MARFLKNIGFGLFLLIFIFVSAKLFFEPQFEAFLDDLIKKFAHEEEKTLTVGFSAPFHSLNPASGAASDRSRLLNIYEGLLSVDRNLEIRPALAVNAGAIDDRTFEFRLRPDVRFHDGSLLTVDDVETSIAYARKNQSSGIKDMLSTIENFEKISGDVFRIKTSKPDPLFLHRLSNVLIFPKAQQNSLETQPIGTGPYAFESMEKGDITLRPFADYWEGQAPFERIFLRTMAAREDRQRAILENATDIVVDVPPEFAIERAATDQNFDFDSFPSLESVFLMFNFDGVFSDLRLREAVRRVLDRDEVARLGFGFARPASQFVSPGIHGFHPDIKIQPVNREAAERLVKEASPLDRVAVTLDLPSGFDAFGKFVQDSLKAIGIDVTLAFLVPEELETKISAGKSEFYFFGWRSELGDANAFFSAVAHSERGSYGQYNGSGYENKKVDELVEEMETMIDVPERLKAMREVMKIIVEDDVIGVPLFTPETLYAVSKKVRFSPRVDGYVLSSEIKPLN